MNNCTSCGQPLKPGHRIRFKVMGVVDNPLRTSVGAFVKDLEWIPGTFRHFDCQRPEHDLREDDYDPADDLY